MYDYVMIRRDEEKQVSYYYNMDDGGLYIHKVESLKSKGDSRGSIIAALSVIGYAFGSRVTFGLNLDGITGFFAVFMLGIIAAFFTCLWIIQMTKRFFIADNRIDTSLIEVKKLYATRKVFMKRYRKLIVFFIAVIIISNMVFIFFPQNIFIFISSIFSWWGIGVSIGLTRPICNYKFRRALMKDKLYTRSVS